MPVDFLRLETGTEPLKERMEKNNAILHDKYRRHPDNDSRKMMIDVVRPPTLKSRHGFRHRAEKQSVICHEPEGHNQIDPWICFGNVTTEKVALNKKKCEYSEEQLKALATTKIVTYNVDYRIFTDGSTSGQQCNGDAGIYI